MNSVQLTVLGLLVYIGLRHFLTPMITSDGSLECKKSNQFSSFIYFCAVAYLIYKVNKQCSSARNLMQSLMSVMGSVLALEIMMNVIWRKLECLVLEVLQAFMYKVLNTIGYDLKTDIPFVFLLWGISFSFLNVALKSDSILEILFKPSSEDEGTDSHSTQIEEIPSGSTTSIYNDVESEIDRTSELHTTEVLDDDSETDATFCPGSINYRSVNTLPSKFIPCPTRRSLRCRSRNCVFAYEGK